MNYEFCDGMTHTIKRGDTLYSISRQHDVPIAMIMRANPYVDVYNLQVGETICIPVMTDGMQRGQKTQPDIQRRNDEPQMQSDVQRMNDNAQPQSGTQRMNDNTQPQSGTQRMNDNTQPQSGTQRMNDNTQMQPDTSAGTSSTEIHESDISGEWARYVSQPGDTLQDIMDRSESGEDEFWMKNSADKMHMLPGIAYYIYEK